MTQPKPLKTLLIVSPENLKVASNLFDTVFDVEVATSMSHAQNLLSNTYGLIVATTCFDESRMFDLLRFCKAYPNSQSVLFIAMRIDGLNMDDMTHQAIQIATKALGAEEYIDLQRLSGPMHEKSMAFRDLLTVLIAKKRLDI
jgi:hypothetical protein